MPCFIQIGLSDRRGEIGIRETNIVHIFNFQSNFALLYKLAIADYTSHGTLTVM